MVATVCRKHRPGAEARFAPGVGGGSVGGGVAADGEGVDDRGELRERVAEERAVDVDHLEPEPCGRAVCEEASERALSVVQRDGQPELVA
jgi:hypothetical protein